MSGGRVSKPFPRTHFSELIIESEKSSKSSNSDGSSPGPEFPSAPGSPPATESPPGPGRELGFTRARLLRSEMGGPVADGPVGREREPSSVDVRSGDAKDVESWLFSAD